MSTEAKDIVAAVAMIEAKQWDAPGVPNLKAVQTIVGDKSVTAEQVAAALASVEPTAPTPEPEVIVDPSTLDRNSPEYAAAVVAIARKAHGELVDAITEQEAIRDTAQAKIAEHRRNDDRHIRVIEQYGPKVSEAESVKRIQQQTIENLMKQKSAAQVVQGAMLGSGMKAYPSLLDASLANRKKDAEQKANYAKFVHQRASEIAA